MAVLLTTGDKAGVSEFASTVRKKVAYDAKGVVTKETQWFAFVTAMGMLMTNHAEGERAAREFMQTDHEYVPYIAMMLYSRLSENDRIEARKVIERFWDRARPAAWEDRLKHRDKTVWREMLIGYYLGDERAPGAKIFGPLDGEEKFAGSGMDRVPMPRLGMKCEAYFYDALLAESQGDFIRRKDSLKEAVRTECRNYFEYAMAKYLLAQMDRGQP
jgi:lipoprotein NlpI